MDECREGDEEHPTEQCCRAQLDRQAAQQANQQRPGGEQHVAFEQPAPELPLIGRRDPTRVDAAIPVLLGLGAAAS